MPTYSHGFSTFPPPGGPRLPDRTNRIVYPTPNTLGLGPSARKH